MLEVGRSHAMLWESHVECNSCHDTRRSRVAEIWHMLVSGFSLRSAVLLVASVLRVRMFLAACHVASRQHETQGCEHEYVTLQHLP